MKKALVVVGVLVVSLVIGFYVHRVWKAPGPQKSGHVAGSAASSAPSASSVPSVEPPKSEWEPAVKLVEVEGEWADPCGPDRRGKGPCGSSMVVISRETAKKQDKSYESIYPWKLELQNPDNRSPITCGFQTALQGVPDSAPYEEAWRVGFCKGGKLGDALQAQRIILLFKGVDKSSLRVRVSSTDVILTRMR